jgi:hypothetical protein
MLVFISRKEKKNSWISPFFNDSTARIHEKKHFISAFYFAAQMASIFFVYATILFHWISNVQIIEDKL